MPRELTVVVLAAGGGTRMKSKTVKVLHRVGGRSMVGHVLSAVGTMEPRRVVCVVGHQRDEVGEEVRRHAPQAVLAVQERLDGTGGAVRVAMEAVGEATGTVVVLAGDTPLLLGESLRAFADEHDAAERAVSVLTAEVADPHGYGRVIRNEEGDLERIVEEKDATEAERAVREISSGIFAFDAAFLRDALPRIGNDNAQGEYYLPDIVQIARDAGLTVGAHVIEDVVQTEGANDRAQMARLGRLLNERIVDGWMREGVTVMDPATTWVEADVQLAPDVTILPGTQLLGATVVAEDAVVGPDSTLKDCEVGSGARVVRTHAELAVVEAGAAVGPFAYLRPGTRLGRDGKIGAFVETKNASVGDGAKVPHLSYVGDAEVGEGSNIGAGTIFANYDGVAKHRTVVGRYARTGANNTFVAPVTIGDGAGTAGGTVVRRDVPPGALAASASPQRNIVGWTLRRRPGSAQADAARRAGAGDSPGVPETRPGAAES